MADKSTGFIYREATNVWKRTSFILEDSKYIIREHDYPTYGPIGTTDTSLSNYLLEISNSGPKHKLKKLPKVVIKPSKTQNNLGEP